MDDLCALLPTIDYLTNCHSTTITITTTIHNTIPCCWCLSSPYCNAHSDSQLHCSTMCRFNAPFSPHFQPDLYLSWNTLISTIVAAAGQLRATTTTATGPQRKVKTVLICQVCPQSNLLKTNRQRDHCKCEIEHGSLTGNANNRSRSPLKSFPNASRYQI